MNVVEAQQGLHKVVEEEVKTPRERQRLAANRGQLPNFAVGDYVMVARVRWQGSTPKLVSTWTGPWRIVTVDKIHVYSVHNIVRGKVKDERVVRNRFYADKGMEMTAALKKVLQQMAEIVDISNAEDGQDFDVKVDWVVGFDEGESSWEPLASMLLILLFLLFFTFRVLVANPIKLLYTVANAAGGLLNREKRVIRQVGAAEVEA